MLKLFSRMRKGPEHCHHFTMFVSTLFQSQVHVIFLKTGRANNYQSSPSRKDLSSEKVYCCHVTVLFVTIFNFFSHAVKEQICLRNTLAMEEFLI